MRKFSLSLILVLLVLALLPAAQAQDEPEPYKLTIMHTNDTHSHNLPNGDEIGGVVTQAAVINQIRAEAPNNLLLDAGDRFMGTLYYTLYLGQDQAQIMNLLDYDAMAVGNHEFDNGDAILEAFIKELSFPLLAANIDVSQSDILKDLILPYTVQEVGGEQIGIIGLITSETPEISSPGDELVFSDDYVGIANGIAADLTAQGINKIIIVSQMGTSIVFPIVDQFENIDVIVDGNSHTLLSNTLQAYDSYPLEYTSPSGQPMLYVQSGEYNLAMGRLDVEFDQTGVITDYGGDSILLSQYITPDPDMQELMDQLTAPVANLEDRTTGATTEVYLTGDRSVCRVEECVFGDLIADAIRADTGTQIAFMNGGGIRDDIDEGEITLGEILSAQPFGNLVSTLKLEGSDVIAMLEHGVSRVTVGAQNKVSREDPAGRFLQVSGMRYSIDPTKEPGSRIVSVEILNDNGDYEALDPDATYTASTIDFLRYGGDDFAILRDNAIEPYDFGRVDYEVTLHYLVEASPITLQPEGRITYVNAELDPIE